MKPALSYSGQLVREHDPDRFFLSLLAPKPCQNALWALLAFNHEIAKTREVVSETQLGLIRLQWWREALGKFYESGEVTEHEIFKDLCTAIKIYDLPQKWFDDLLYAREFDLEDVLPGNLEGMLNYADFTSTPLFKLAVKITGGEAEQEPVQPIAMNYALVGLLRAVPYHAAQQRCYMPANLLAEQGISEYALYKGQDIDKLTPVIEDIMGEFVLGIRTENRFLRASQHLAQMYYDHIKLNNFNVFSPKLSIPPRFKEMRLMFRSMV